MTTLTLDLFQERPAPAELADAGDRAASGAEGGEPRQDAPPAAEGRGRRTLDELIVGMWEDLTAHHAVACPMCGGDMAPRYASGAAPVGGRCRSCDSTLG